MTIIDVLRERIKTQATGGGFGVRHLMLAYALLRGRPYRLLELKTREDNHPSPSLLEETSGKTLEEVLAWLDAPASPELTARAVASRQAHLESKRARAEAMRRTAGAA